MEVRLGFRYERVEISIYRFIGLRPSGADTGKNTIRIFYRCYTVEG